MKTPVFLDTNFLLMPYKENIDIFEEIDRLFSSSYSYEIVTISSVKKELENLSVKEKGTDRIGANVGLGLLEKKNIKVIEGISGLSADKDLLEYAEKNKDIIVCTNDKPLKQELRKKGIRLITMRSRTHLEFV